MRLIARVPYHGYSTAKAIIGGLANSLSGTTNGIAWNSLSSAMSLLQFGLAGLYQNVRKIVHERDEAR
jgi:hypothetical protein